MPGVQVNTNSGRPGGRTNVRIRGFSSINSSNNPLYVVDGIMLPQGNLSQYSSAIDYLNPNDIVSVEVLKDASSTAIYGSRGANGVIMITTKKGNQYWAPLPAFSGAVVLKQTKIDSKIVKYK